MRAGSCRWLLLLFVGGPLAAQQVELLPDASGRAELARLAPAAEGLLWEAWVGGGLTLVRHRHTALVFDADIETLVGHEFRSFDADQVGYHLAGSLRHSSGPYTFTARLRHVSRHRVDRAKQFSFDWNVLGLELERRFEQPFAGRVSAFLGTMLQSSRPHYTWELRLQAEAHVWQRSWGGAYARGDLDLIGATASPEYPRDGFADRRLECGLRLTRGARRIELFLGWEHRNDVLLERPSASSRALFGLRLQGGERAVR